MTHELIESPFIISDARAESQAQVCFLVAYKRFFPYIPQLSLALRASNWKGHVKRCFQEPNDDPERKGAPLSLSAGEGMPCQQCELLGPRLSALVRRNPPDTHSLSLTCAKGRRSSSDSPTTATWACQKLGRGREVGVTSARQSCASGEHVGDRPLASPLVSSSACSCCDAETSSRCLPAGRPHDPFSPRACRWVGQVKVAAAEGEGKQNKPFVMHRGEERVWEDCLRLRRM